MKPHLHTLAAIALTLLLTACGGNGGGTPAADTAATTEPTRSALAVGPTMWLEPGTSTTIAAGQTIQLHVAYKDRSGQPYPRYLDPALLSWSSSDPARAAVGSDGSVTGIAEGSSTLTARFGTLVQTLRVQVAGTLQQRTVAVPGQGQRRYTLFTPRWTGTHRVHPVLLALHGGGGSAMGQAATSQLVKLGQEQQIYMLFLEGSGAVPTFNAGACCGAAAAGGVDDVAYARSLLDELATWPDVRVDQVYATGFSNGGMMVHRLACALADRLAGVASVAGVTGQFDNNGQAYYACNPARPIPVLHVHATNDRNVPFGGGPGDGLSDTSFYPVAATVADWRTRNNVDASFTAEAIGASTVCRRHATPARQGQASAAVTLCTVNPVDVYDPVNEVVFGGGHSWPGGVRSPAAGSDTPIADFDASATLWQVLRR